MLKKPSYAKLLEPTAIQNLVNLLKLRVRKSMHQKVKNRKQQMDKGKQMKDSNRIKRT